MPQSTVLPIMLQKWKLFIIGKLSKMMERLDKLRMRATGNGVTQARISNNLHAVVLKYRFSLLVPFMPNRIRSPDRELCGDVHGLPKGSDVTKSSLVDSTQIHSL